MGIIGEGKSLYLGYLCSEKLPH